MTNPLGMIGIDVPRAAGVSSSTMGVVGAVRNAVEFAVAGALLGRQRKRAAPPWSIMIADSEIPGSPPVFISGAYPATNIGISSSTNWANVVMPGQDQPFARWSNGEAESFTADLTLFAANGFEFIESQIAKLRELTKPYPPLSRPPRVSFAQGSTTFYGVVTGIRESYRSHRDAGSARFVVVTISMRSALSSDPAPDAIDPTKPPARSRWHIVRDGEDFEQIAADEYGSPIIGVLVRQDHLDTNPQPGDLVFLPDRGFYTRRYIAPDSYFLSPEPANEAAFDTLYDARGGTQLVKG